LQMSGGTRGSLLILKGCLYSQPLIYLRLFMLLENLSWIIQ
jgi:hypothetical protein